MDESTRCSIGRTAAFSEQTFATLHDLQQNDEMTDFVIKLADSRTIRCHRLVLFSTCPVFRTMFESGMKESRVLEMDLSSWEPDVISSVINYLYTGSISFNWENISEVLKVCNFLQLNELKQRCVQSIPACLSPENAIGWYCLGKQLNLNKVVEASQSIMEANFEEVVQHDEFMQMTLEDLLSYITNPDIEVRTMDAVLGACLTWVNFDESIRQVHVGQILKDIDLAQCSLSYLQQACNLDVIRYSSVLQSLEEHISQSCIDPFEDSYKLAVIGGQSKSGETSQHCVYLGGGLKPWKTFTSFPEGVTCKWCSICQIPGGFLVTGGFKVQNSSKCYKFSLVTRSWSELRGMGVSRSYHGSAFAKGKVYAIGGLVSGSPSSSVEKLNLSCVKWKKSPSCPCALTKPKVAVYDECIYVIPDKSVNQIPMLKFNPSKKSWGKMASLPSSITCTSGSNVAIVNDGLMLAGGTQNICALYRFASDSWSHLSQPLLSHVHGAMVAEGKNVYMLGGAWQDENNSHVEKYDADTDAWTTCDWKMKQPLYGHHAFFLDFYDEDI